MMCYVMSLQSDDNESLKEKLIDCPFKLNLTQEDLTSSSIFLPKLYKEGIKELKRLHKEFEDDSIFIDVSFGDSELGKSLNIGKITLDGFILSESGLMILNMFLNDFIEALSQMNIDNDKKDITWQ